MIKTTIMIIIIIIITIIIIIIIIIILMIMMMMVTMKMTMTKTIKVCSRKQMGGECYLKAMKIMFYKAQHINDIHASK